MSSRIPYIGGLDGLRALAVIAVLLFHAELFWSPVRFAGGFLGVDVFFVLSGYLITSLLLAERGRGGAIDVRAFWLRRARRLLPAVVLLIVGLLVYAAIFLPDDVAALRVDVLAAFAYVTNWYLIFDHQSYFESWGRPSLLQHLWSLAIEEQFYLLWPLLFAGGIRVLRPTGLLIALLAGAAASAVLMTVLYQNGADTSRIYYGTDTRAMALLLGSALAFVWTPERAQAAAGRARVLALDIAGFASLGVLVYFFIWLSADNPFLYQGGFAMTAVASVVVIAALVQSGSRLGFALGLQPLRWVGQRSYSIYLWHWPVYMVTRPGLDVSFDGWQLLAFRLAIVVVLAELSYRIVEMPIRRGALSRAWNALRAGTRRQRFRWGAAYTTALGSLATGIVLFLAVVLGVAVGSFASPETPAFIAALEQPFEPPAQLAVGDSDGALASAGLLFGAVETPTPTATTTPTPAKLGATPLPDRR
ncbi:MAG: acyltransferase, partial [Chloroflexi bacterium]|nr:acyltransferase [Chloroflexota bacterium]